MNDLPLPRLPPSVPPFDIDAIAHRILLCADSVEWVLRSAQDGITWRAEKGGLCVAIANDYRVKKARVTISTGGSEVRATDCSDGLLEFQLNSVKEAVDWLCGLLNLNVPLGADGEKVALAGYVTDHGSSAPVPDTNVIDLMAALKRSLGQAPSQERLAPPTPPKQTKTRAKEPVRNQPGLKPPIRGGKVDAKSADEPAVPQPGASPARPSRKRA